MSKKSVQDIVEEKYSTFANMIKEITNKAELDRTLILYLRQKEDLVIKKARDEDLLRLKQKKAELSKPYTQTISALKNMMNCIYKFGHNFESEMKEQFEINMVQYAKQLSYVKKKKDEDEDLNAVTEAIKTINEDYNPSIALLELKAEYIAHITKERFELDEPQKIEI